MTGPIFMLKIRWPIWSMDIPTVSCIERSLFINLKTLEEVQSVPGLLVVLSGRVSKISTITVFRCLGVLFYFIDAHRHYDITIHLIIEMKSRPPKPPTTPTPPTTPAPTPTPSTPGTFRVFQRKNNYFIMFKCLIVFITRNFFHNI